MRTNIEIDDELMDEAMKASGAKTKRAAVEQALRMFVRIKGQGAIRELFGKVKWEGDLDAMRRSEKWNGSSLTWAEDAALRPKDILQTRKKAA
jgi:Arc/MetJ family transcription regulator